MMGRIDPVVALLIVNCFIGQVCSAEYLGKLIGKLSELHHAVSGEVYAVDGRTLYIKDFTYDGQGPAAYFYASSGKSANGAGFRLRDENGSGEVIRRYRKEGVTLTLPDGKTLRDIKIFYVWCEEFDVNFGDVKIPRTLDFPRPLKIEALKGVHGISSDNIVVVDAQTLLIPNLSYDGEAPDAKFWVGRGPKPSPQGIRVPDENGKEIPLRRYDRKTVVLTLPGDLTVFDIGHFGIWCEAFTVDFGHVQIPQGMNVPPSLKMLGVSPQKRRILQDYPQQQQQQSKLNCEVLNDNLAFEVRWAVAGESIVLQLVAKLDDREYVSFGISGEDDKSVMIGGDVVVAWVDKETLKGYAEDYYLNDKSQCSGPTGSCPDNRLSEKDNSYNIRLLNAAMVNGYSIVTYQRPLKASDKFDRSIHTNRSQAIIWAIGPLNQRNEVSFHSQYLKTDKFIDFGRPAKWNCPMPESDQTPMRAAVSVENRQKIIEEAEPAVEVEEEPATQAPRRNSNRRRGGNRGNQQQVDNEKSATKSRPQTRNAQRGSVNTQKPVPTPKPVSKSKAWEIPPIECDEPDDGVFYAQMGPTGGKHGYPAITGHVGWGISWYINGLLIPEINVVRGKTYTFVVEGGEDPEIPAKYHPFYITDDSVGGYEHKTEEEKKNVTIFAGARKRKDGKYVPNATGRLCNWTPQGEKDADDFDSFGAYQRILKLICDSGEPGFIQWTPDRNTPDTVYYQCFTHRYLGWKINVLDTCDRETAASETKSISVPAPSDIKDQYNTDLENSPSQRIETRVKPNDIHFQENKEDKTSLKTFSELSTKLSKNPDHHGKQEQPIQMILIKSQQGFFDPHNSGSGKYQNPFTFENPYKRLSDFRPSPIMDHTKVTQTLTSTTIKPQNSVNDIILSPPALPSNTKIIRRPPPRPYIQNLPPRPHYVPLRHSSIPMSIKKPIYRPRPPMFSNIKNMFMTAVSQMNRLPTLPLPQLPPKPQIIPTESPKILPETQPEIKNIEISPQQPSTEKDPELQTSSQLLSISEVAPNMLPARNTGFKPSSVVIEKGFKPIISQEVKERLSEEPELSYESQIGVINQRHYEPVFIPEKYKFRKAPYPKKNVMKIIYKRPRSLDPTDMEPIAEAAERVDTYLTYLPPLTQTQKPVDIVRQPSNIDFESPEIDLESPPDVVVTFDGRKVSGASLTAKVADRPNILEMRASKAAELIRAHPQSTPYKGELPPLDIDFTTGQINQKGVLNRDLDTPNVGTTKLTRVYQLTDEEDEPKTRRKREAHHTPEHTLEQEMERNRTQTKNSSSDPRSPWFSRISVIVVSFYLMYL